MIGFQIDPEKLLDASLSELFSLQSALERQLLDLSS